MHKKLIQDLNCQIIFIDSSLLGKLVKILHNAFKGLKIQVFFHNCEYEYIKSIYHGPKNIYIPIGLLKAKKKLVSMLIKLLY